jgi:hypothetical protein
MSYNKKFMYSGRKITATFGNATVKWEEKWKEQGGARLSEHV